MKSSHIAITLKIFLISLLVLSLSLSSISANANSNIDDLAPNVIISEFVVAEYDFITDTETTRRVPYRDDSSNPETQQIPNGSDIIPNVYIEDDEDSYDWSFIPNVRLNNTPYRSVCSLLSGHRISAFIVGKKILMTAAHCVYNASPGTWDTEAYAMPHAPSDASDTYIRTNGTKVLKAIIPMAYKSNPTVANDWAILVVEDDVGTANGILTFDTTTRQPNEEVVTIGYPNVGDSELENTMHESPGRITTVSYNYFRHCCDTSSGSSGSPVLKLCYVNGTPTYKVIGIHHGGHEQGQFNDAHTTDTLLVKVVNYYDSQYD